MMVKMIPYFGIIRGLRNIGIPRAAWLTIIALLSGLISSILIFLIGLELTKDLHGTVNLVSATLILMATIVYMIYTCYIAEQIESG